MLKSHSYIEIRRAPTFDESNAIKKLPDTITNLCKLLKASGGTHTCKQRHLLLVAIIQKAKLRGLASPCDFSRVHSKGRAKRDGPDNVL